MTQLRLVYVDPATLAENPLNWKIHTSEQLEALRAAIGDPKIGWVKPLIYNERTQRLLDGHGRRSIAPPGQPVPVVIGEWDEDAEAEILATLDPMGWMAKTDAARWDLLTKGDALRPALNPQSDTVRELLEAVRQSAVLLGAAESVPASETESSSSSRRPRAAEVPDAIWPSDNVWGVPVLDLSLQADAVEFPVTVWGSQGQTRAMRGTWVFYTNDSCFTSIWQNPAKPLVSGAPCLVEPNYSTADQTPFAVAIGDVYRKRWLSRYWQSQGRRVFVDINVHHSLLRNHEATPGQAPALLGVPRGWKAYATRAHANRPEMLEAEHDVAVAHAGGTVLFLVYGGGKRVQELSRARGWVWVAERADLVKKEVA